MSDENKKLSLDQSTSDNSVDIGALLVEARKNLNLSISDIAAHLNLSKMIINQLENNQFSGNLPLAFVRGYIISYAMKVGLDIKMIKQAFDNQMGAESLSLKRVESLSVFEKNRNAMNSNNTIIKLVSFLIVVVVIFFAGRAGWDKYKTLRVTNNETLNESLSEVNLDSSSNGIALNLDSLPADAENYDDINDVQNQSNEDQIDLNNQMPSSSSESDENIVQSELNNASLINTSLNNNELDDNKLIQNINEKISLPKENITLNFFADCWVQITDATGEELAFGIKNAGKVMSLNGVPPITLVLGDPSVVNLMFKNKNIELAEYRAKRRAKIILK